MAKNFDLSQIRKPTVREKFLKPVEKNQDNITNGSTKKEVKKNKMEKEKTVKMGRPRITEEPLTEKVSINLTSSEMDKLKDKIGLVPAAAYLRNELKQKGII